MNTTHPFVGTHRVTETTGPTGDLAIQVVGDQDADGRVTSASVCVGGEFLLTAAEARETTRHPIAADDELDALSDPTATVGA
jgi:hypothetical protein